MLIDNIDFNRLYQHQMRLAKPTEKSPQYWDTRAEEMAERCGNPESPYLLWLLSHIDFANASTLLDVGCGPGTVCLNVASRLAQVWGLDYSDGMLAVAKKRAADMNLQNVTLIKKAWEDNWDEVPVCDIAVASRSTLVGNLAEAMLKLNQKARLRVYTTHPVSRTFNGAPVPNYIYAVNILYQAGIEAKVDFIRDPTHRDWALVYWDKV